MYRFATSLDSLLITIGLVCSAIVGLVWPVFYVLLGGLLDDLAGMIPTTTSTSSSASSTSSPAAARLLSEVLGAVAATAAAPGPPGGRPGGGPGGFTPPGGGGGFPVPGGGAVPGGGGLVPPNPFAPAAAGVSPEMEAITQNCLLLLAVAVMGFVAGSLSLSCLMYTTERQCNAVRVAWVRSAFAQDATWYGAHNVHQLGTQMSIDIAEYYKGTGVRLLHLSFVTCTHAHIARPTATSFPPSPPHHLFRSLFSPSQPPLLTRSTRSSRSALLTTAPIAPLAQERLSTLVASLSGFVGGVVVGLTAGWQLSLAVMFICPAQFFIVRHFASKVRVEMRSPDTACSFYYPHPPHHTMGCLAHNE